MLPVIIAVFPGCGCRTVKLDHLSYEREKKIDNRARNGSPSIETIRRGDISKVKKFHDNVYIYICVYIERSTLVSSFERFKLRYWLSFKYFRISSREFGSIESVKKNRCIVLYTSDGTERRGSERHA